jgi:plastocyanin
VRTASLALAILAVAACSSDPNMNNPPVTTDVEIVDGAATKGALAFDPNPFTMSLASQSEVEWGNADGTTHTVVADGGEFTSANISPGSSYSHIFTNPGTYAYHCSIHPSMVGSIVVTP